jgi:VWFA-related protein
MKSGRNLITLCTLFLIIASMAFMLFGCGGGSSNNSNAAQIQTGDLELSKSAYNFGNVTIGNTATLSVIISNTGTDTLSITNFALSDNSNFAIDPGECGTAPYSIAAGMSCAVIVTFSPTAEGSYSETLSITSDDPNTPTATATLTGEGTTISAYTVTLNQIETDCSTNTVTAYVSVTDQEGFAVTDLTVGDFSISEDGGAPIAPLSVDFAKNTSFQLSVAILMDYSGSVYDVPNLIETIENSVDGLVGTLRASDQAEIIKFASVVQKVQDFTADKALLDLAIYQVPVNIGAHTALYDAIYQGIDDAANTLTDRRAVLVLTDGFDSDGNGGPGSVHTLNQTIELGKTLGTPVFTVNVGANTYANLLQQIASETGGQYFDSPDTDRIQTIYSQLSNILNNQYVLTYTSVGTGADVNAVVSLQHDTGTGGTISDDSNALTYSSCP